MGNTMESENSLKNICVKSENLDCQAAIHFTNTGNENYKRVVELK